MLPRIPDLHFNFILLQSDKTMGNRFFLSYSTQHFCVYHRQQAIFCWYILFRNFPTLCTINPTLQQSESVWWGNQITNHPCLRPPCTHQAKVPIPFIYRDIVVEVAANKVKLYTTSRIFRYRLTSSTGSTISDFRFIYIQVFNKYCIQSVL